ncbi:MAG: endonuclease MutS2 [Firmicutes bacterium]|nr:endonuclease MutS2 [Bacillota bacterium]
MNEKSLKKLEFDKIIGFLMNECSSPLGKEKAEQLLPHRDKVIVEGWQKETTEARNVLIYLPNFGMGPVKDIRDSVALAKKNGILDGAHLRDIMITSRSGKRLKTTLGQTKEDYPIIKGLANRIVFINSLETAIEEAIGDDGEVLDSASVELADIRRKMRRTNDRIREKLDNLLRNSNTSQYLQENIITIRNDRYVVPVKQEYRNQVPGLVHDQSSSGATLFIEPMSVLDLNNDLRKLHGEEEAEVHRILTRLSGLVGANAAELKANLEIITELDFIFAKGKLSLKMNGFEPILNEEGIIHLKKARHPLLGEKAVPIDLEMNPELNGIIITGPNTGGKTVSLKIAGLFILMAQAGLHLPTSDRSEVGVFRGVYADIGDEQSIEQSLSTFSSHMVNIVDILAKAGRNNLVLLDELGAGTDPVEGAALAMAMIDTLMAKGVKVIVTTHYSELKAYAYNHPHLANASVEFDVDTLRPTYRLLMGVPGRSNAFDIALSLGVDKNVVLKADEYMSKEQKEVQDFLANLEEGRARTEKAKREAEDLKQRLEAVERDMVRREEELKQKEATMIRKAEERADRLIRERRREADEALREIKSMLSEVSAKEREKVMTQVKAKKKKIEDLSSKPEETVYGGEKLTHVEKGDEVYIPRLNKNAVVLDVVSKNEVLIQAGIMKVTMRLSELRAATQKKEDQSNTYQGHMKAAKARTVKNEISLRGMTADEAEEELSKFLDDACLANLQEIKIIHGLGTGVLKKMVYDYLKKDHRVKEQRLGGYYEGGAGVTIATLK